MFNQVMKDKNKPINTNHHNSNGLQHKNYKVKNLTHLKNNKTSSNHNNSNNTSSNQS